MFGLHYCHLNNYYAADIHFALMNYRIAYIKY